MTRHSSTSPFWALLGMELVDVKKGWAKVRLPFDNKLKQPMGIAHGGAIFATADSAVVMALLGMVRDLEYAISSKTGKTAGLLLPIRTYQRGWDIRSLIITTKTLVPTAY